MPRTALLTLCLLAACCSATPALAKQPAAAAPTTTLPDARALVDRHIAASGGKDALAKGNHGTMTGSFSMPASNLSSPMTVWVDGVKRLASKVELPGMGSIQAGIFEDVVWAMDPFQGPRILEGNERAQQIERKEVGFTKWPADREQVEHLQGMDYGNQESKPGQQLQQGYTKGTFFCHDKISFSRY